MTQWNTDSRQYGMVELPGEVVDTPIYTPKCSSGATIVGPKLTFKLHTLFKGYSSTFTLVAWGDLANTLAFELCEGKDVICRSIPVTKYDEVLFYVEEVILNTHHWNNIINKAREMGEHVIDFDKVLCKGPGRYIEQWDGSKISFGMAKVAGLEG